MRVAIVTVAGLSSRFNEGLPEHKRHLKCIYTSDAKEETLLNHLLQKLSYADRIIVVGGYRYDALKFYMEQVVCPRLRDKVLLVRNEHYSDLSSGYSLYLALERAFVLHSDIKDILFAEGDLEIDQDSLDCVINSKDNVATYSRDPIDAKKSVVLYQDTGKRLKYVFNRLHGAISIDEPFLRAFNSGQVWKFNRMDILKRANEIFIESYREETNLAIVREYFNAIPVSEVEILGFKRWINCNTRQDYEFIRKLWEDAK